MQNNTLTTKLFNHPDPIYVGNDLVATNLPRAIDKHLNYRFINKVFTDQEQLLISSTAYPNIMLWALWAGKEAAFKALQKKLNCLVFSYKKFQVDLHIDHINTNKASSLVYGTITYDQEKLLAKWEINYGCYVHCIAICTNLKIAPNTLPASTSYHIFSINPDNHQQESQQTRSQAIQYLQRSGLNDNITITRQRLVVNKTSNFGPPAIWLNNQRVPGIDISLSHDKIYGAIAYHYARRS